MEPLHSANSDPRATFPEVEAWLADLSPDVSTTIRSLGQLLVGLAEQPSKAEDAQRFTVRHLGLTHYGEVVYEQCELSGVGRLTNALAVDELIAEHSAEVGPGLYREPPGYSRTTVGDTVYNHPKLIRAGFPRETLLPDAPCVVGIDARTSYGDQPQLTVFVRGEHRAGARTVIDRIAARANELNPYRGRACRASYISGNIHLQVVELPANLTRETVVVSPDVWREIDLGISAVRDRHELLNAHGLGSRRGVLLVGPPGVGKSAISAAVANELAGEFTVIYVEARAGEQLLTDVVEEAHKLGGPVLLAIEDVDLWCRDRARPDSTGLSQLLQAMDIAPNARILTIASTNDAATLDRAAIRTGRFDSIVEVGFPSRANAARILDSLLSGIDAADDVDTAAVAAALPAETSGSDLREIVRRGILTAGSAELTTAGLLTEVGSGRYRAELPSGGSYL